MRLLSSRFGSRTTMNRRGRVAVVVVMSAFVLLLASVVSSAPTPVDDSLRLINKEVPYPPEGPPNENDADVEELHSLNSNVKSTAMPTPPKPNNANHLVSESDKAAEDEKRSSDNKSDFALSDFTSSSDTPRDMAEYIFWTGDEGSVTTAIKDFVDQGLMSAEDGKDFMEEVRYDLHQIQMRYGTAAEKVSSEVMSASDRTKYNLPKEEEQDDESRQLAELAAKNKVGVALEGEKPHEGEIVVTSYRPQNKSQDEPVRPIKIQERDRLEDEIKLRGASATDIKEGNLDESHIVDLLSNEYSLEEIIYQLARILFSQSLSQAGHPEAEEALKKFADFLEKESKEGKMSPQLQKKVLDVLLMSLFDAMGDQGHQQVPSLPGKTSPMENLANDKH